VNSLNVLPDTGDIDSLPRLRSIHSALSEGLPSLLSDTPSPAMSLSAACLDGASARSAYVRSINSHGIGHARPIARRQSTRYKERQ